MNTKQDKFFQAQMMLMVSKVERKALEDGKLELSESDPRADLFAELDRLICEAEDDEPV